MGWRSISNLTIHHFRVRIIPTIIQQDDHEIRFFVNDQALKGK